LREAISQYIERLYGLYYDPKDQILVTVGVSEAMWLALKAIIDPGDEVLVPEPCFVANPAAVEMAGGVPVMVETFVEDDFQITGEMLEAADPYQLSQQPHRRNPDARTDAGNRRCGGKIRSGGGFG
jgi:aspartate/methionine/tyrosine aminotransferase